MTETPPIESSADEKPRRWWFVHIGMLVAFLFFFCFVAVLYAYWIKTPEPTAFLVIPTGHAELDGTRIRVEGDRLAKPIEVMLDQSNKYGTKIYLVPGDYELQIFSPGGDTPARSKFAMAPYYQRTINLVPPPSPVQP